MGYAAEQGTVRKWSDDKGYGFISRESGEKDVFVHYTAILSQGSGRKSLTEGERVEFEVEDSTKGPQAKNVRRLAR